MGKPPVHVLQVTGAPAGGIRKHVHAILSGLGGLKQSYAASFSAGDSVFANEFPGIRRDIGGRVISIDVRKRPAISDVVNLLNLKRYISSNGVTIVHGHGAKGGLYARLLSLMCGIPSVYTPHGGAMHPMFAWPEDVVYRSVERLLLPLTGFFVFESQYTADAYSKRVGKKPRNALVNYNGVPLPDIGRVSSEAVRLGYSAPPHKIPDIGVFGILRPQKGQLAALEAVAGLRRLNTAVRLHVFGAGPDREALEVRAGTLGIADMTVFHGEVPDVLPHMWAMDLVLIPSIFESFGYVALEAFSVGRPVAAAATGGLKEIVSDGVTGVLFNEGEAAAAVLRILNEPGFSKRLTESAYAKFQESFSVDAMLSRLEKVYSGLHPGGG